MLTEPKNIMISDVTLNWARLDTPADNPFGGAPSWEVQIGTDDAAKAKTLQDEGLNVKVLDGHFTVSLRRKSETKDGTPMAPVRVVDAAKNPIDGVNRRKIGNGSEGNVIVWLAPYEYAGKKGVTASLTAVQVTEMVEYSAEASMDFDAVSATEETADLF